MKELERGGLAIVIRANTHQSHIGLIVETIRPIPAGELFVAPDNSKWCTDKLGWLVRSQSRSFIGVTGGTGEYAIFETKNLRPIRNDPGQDETLTWLDVPTTDKAAA